MKNSVRDLKNALTSTNPRTVKRYKAGMCIGLRRVCHWCFYHILASSVIYYWTDPRKHGIYLFNCLRDTGYTFPFQHGFYLAVVSRVYENKFQGFCSDSSTPSPLSLQITFTKNSVQWDFTQHDSKPTSHWMCIVWFFINYFCVIIKLCDINKEKLKWSLIDVVKPM